QQQADITVQFAYSRQVDADRLKEQLSSAGYCVFISSRKPLAFKFKALGKSSDLLDELNRLLKELYAVQDTSKIVSAGHRVKA
ncbi:MAG: hypothetical protein ACQES4_11865, partial [Bacillota bacterium]